MKFLPKFLLPNERIADTKQLFIVGCWVFALLAFWSLADLGVLPGPAETATAFGQQWQRGAGIQMWTSLMVSLESIAWATVMGLFLTYLSTIPMFKAPVALIGQLRFLSLTGLVVIFLKYADGGHALKVSVLTFAILTFFVNTMAQVVADIPKKNFDHARTMGLNRFQVLREVVVRGTLAQAFDSIRMNAAMAWMMLTAVEGLSRSEGGIGVLLLNLNRMQQYDAIFGIQAMILLVGLGQDAFIKYLKILVCPYAKKA